jgi:NAD(P)-dependent dehydrogenase (short-subunit alcohol dehydrogenase family)
MKNILITGANRGLGLGFTRHYLSAGHRVYATARNPQQSTEFDELQRAFKNRFTALQLELTNQRSIDALAPALNGVELDLVINNAGMLPDQAFGQWTSASFETAFRVNASGPSMVAQALVPLMKKGSVLANLSSGLGSCGLNINPETGLDAYAASKAALNMVTRRLAAKPETRHITVVAFDPGWVKTRMGGEEAELTVAESITDLTATIERVTPDHSGLFLSRKGEPLPW